MSNVTKKDEKNLENLEGKSERRNFVCVFKFLFCFKGIETRNGIQQSMIDTKNPSVLQPVTHI